MLNYITHGTDSVFGSSSAFVIWIWEWKRRFIFIPSFVLFFSPFFFIEAAFFLSHTNIMISFSLAAAIIGLLFFWLIILFTLKKIMKKNLDFWVLKRQKKTYEDERQIFIFFLQNLIFMYSANLKFKHLLFITEPLLHLGAISVFNIFMCS